MEIKIRNESAEDIEPVREILRATFQTNAESKLVDALRANHKAIISLVAVHDDQVLGHIMFSPVSTTPPGAARGIGLAPVAVRPDVQGKGIGSDLIRAGLRLCQESGYDFCVVLGSPEYYQRFGFETASKFDVGNEYGVDAEFMLMQFSERGISKALVKYAPEFALFSV